MKRAGPLAGVAIAMAVACSALVPDLPARPDGGVADGSSESGPAADGANEVNGGDAPVGTGDASDDGALDTSSSDHTDANTGDAATDHTTDVDASVDAPVVDAGPVSPPFVSPTQLTQNNDFLVALQSDPGATICVRIDGYDPTCDATGTSCTGGSVAYDGVKQVAINGTFTDSVGQVAVKAIARRAGQTAPWPACNIGWSWQCPPWTPRLRLKTSPTER
jgi:hypothetical protein